PVPHSHAFPTRRSSDLLPGRLPVHSGRASIFPARQPIRFSGSAVLRKKTAGFQNRFSVRRECTFVWSCSSFQIRKISARKKSARSEEHTSELQSRENLV